MDSTITCVNDVKESLLSTQTTEELSLITPRDIRSLVKSWAADDTDKERAEELISKWLVQYRKPKGYITLTDEKFTLEMKHYLLTATLQLADRYINRTVKKAGAYTGRVEKYEKEMKLFIDKIKNLSDNKKTRLLTTLKKINYNFIWEYSDKKIIEEEEIKRLANEIRQMTGHKKTIPVMKLAREAYDDIFGESHFYDSYYPYLHSFLLEILNYEYWVSMEVKPHIDRLNYLQRPSSANTLKETLTDKEWYDRWWYYSQVGIKNKHRYAATINSDKWAIPFNDFVLLYRALHGKTNKFITSPLHQK